MKLRGVGVDLEEWFLAQLVNKFAAFFGIKVLCSEEMSGSGQFNPVNALLYVRHTLELSFHGFPEWSFPVTLAD